MLHGVVPEAHGGIAGDQVCSHSFHNRADGSFGDTIEVADVGRRSLLRDDVLVQHLAVLGGDELASVVAVIVDDSADRRIGCLSHLFVEVSHELPHDVGDVAFTPERVNELKTRVIINEDERPSLAPC